MKFDVYNPYSNVSVTDYYVTVIERALVTAGYTVNKITELKKSSDNEGIVVVYPYDSYRAKKLGYKKVILWIQGLSPEESYMRNHSRIKKAVLSDKEYRGICKADVILMVSAMMKQHYEKKYHLKFNDNVFFMPCFNSELEESAFFTPDKYKNNTFCYAGGLAVWQCFEETVKLYKYVEDRIENASLEVYTPDQEAAKKILKKNSIRNYTLDFVSQEELAQRMRKIKFGFVLREDNIVNNVATPTKFSSYMSSGIIPIYSKCVKDFYQHTFDKFYVLPLDGFDLSKNGSKIIQLCEKNILPNDVWEEFRNFFDDYYSAEKYIDHLKSFFQHLRD